MVNSLLRKVFGTRNDRILKRLQKNVNKINLLEPEFEGLSDDQLRARTDEFRKRYQDGETLDQLLPEAFAVAREGARRVLNMRHFDVQLIGGMVLHEGMIAEMRTGEGKTLVATLFCYLNALPGKGAHVVTVNDYLARRDAAWMGKLYQFLGMTTGVVVAGMSHDEKQQAYNADITYGTNNEFGFDYLRDNMAFRMEDKVQRELNAAVVDEVDSILIDEARTPLIISGPTDDNSELYLVMKKRVLELVRQEEEDGPGDYSIDEKQKQIHFTEEGHQHVEELLEKEGLLQEGQSLYDAANLTLMHHLNAALRALALYHKDVDYIVKDDQVVIVDEFTGRTMPGRRWSEGLHQAVEAKEGVAIQNENQTLASITFQNYFRLYGKLSGMTGTADTEAAEFQQIYGLEVVVMPPNKPMIREDRGDLVFLTVKEKFDAVAEDIRDCQQRGQPVLVGTTSIEASERLSGILGKRGVPHEVLNAKHHEREAMIIAKAGQLGSVTVSTNMAGRGTDILLGHFEFADLIEHWQQTGLAPKSLDPEDDDPTPRLIDHWVDHFLASDSDLGKKARNGSQEAKQEALTKYWKGSGIPALPFEPMLSVAQLGGLHIVGTERHESRRIDNQLRGRAGRQGDPGSSVFFVSLEDPLMRRFMREGVKKILAKLGMGEGQEITSPLVTRNIERAQKKVEERNFDIRKNLLEYDQVNDEQRRAIYGRRTAMLRGEQLEETTWELIELMLAKEVPQHFPRSQGPSEWTLSELTGWLRRKFELQVDQEALRASGGAEEGIGLIRAEIGERMAAMREEYGDEDYELTLQFLLLRAFDEKWKEHLRELEALRQAVGLRGYAQQDPKVEYRREASAMFSEMEEHIAESVTDGLFKIRVTTEMNDMLSGRWQPTRLTHEEAAMFSAGGSADPQAPDANDPIGSTPERQEPIKREAPKVGRNDPCPCGSGKKYKKCCGRGEA